MNTDFLIESEITITPDDLYKFRVFSGEEIGVECIHDQVNTTINFGSFDEMEAVANAMLQIVKLSREI